MKNKNKNRYDWVADLVKSQKWWGEAELGVKATYLHKENTSMI